MNMARVKGKSYLTKVVKGIAQLKVDRLMEVHARDPTSSMEDVLNALIQDTLHSEDLPLEDRFGSLAMATYMVGMLQGLALVRESVSEDVMIKIVSALSPDFEEGEEGVFTEEVQPRSRLQQSRDEDKVDQIFRAKEQRDNDGEIVT
jgi:hypothetical protein